MGMAFKSADELNAERLADRHVHLNSNGFVLGTSSAGKSFKVKFELAHWFLNQFDVEPIVIDPDMSDGGVGSSAVKPNNSVIALRSSLRSLMASRIFSSVTVTPNVFSKTAVTFTTSFFHN